MDPLRKKKKYLDSYAKYTSIALQMLVIIIAGVLGGWKLDEWLDLKFPVFTILLSLISVSFAIYTAIRDFLKNDKSDMKNGNSGSSRKK